METFNIFSFEKVYSVFEKSFHLSLNELSPKFCVKNVRFSFVLESDKLIFLEFEID